MKTYNDVFAEDLVVRQRPLFVALVRCGSIVAGILLTIGAYFVTGMVLKNYSSAVFPMLFALIVIGVVMVFRFTGLEYEYSFYSGDVDIDKIVGKRKRTRLISFNCRDVELMAPYTEANEADANGNFVQKLDVRGTGAGMRDWFVIVKSEDGSRRIFAFSPSDKMINAFRQFVRGTRFRDA